MITSQTGPIRERWLQPLSACLPALWPSAYLTPTKRSLIVRIVVDLPFGYLLFILSYILD